MKTSIKSLAFALSFAAVTATSAFSMAEPINKTTAVSYQESVYKTKDGKLAIALNKEVGGAVEIRLKNTAGEVLYTHRVTKSESQSRMRLDVSELPDGNYQVEITNGVDTKTHTVTLATQQPETPSRVITMR